MAFKLILSSLFLFLNISLLNAKNIKKKFNDKQIELIQTTYNIGKSIVASNGMTFEKALTSILLTETTAGKYIIGDSFNKDKTRRHLLKNSLGPFQMRISTVRVMSYKIPSLSFLKSKSDFWIMNRLLNDFAFGAILAGNYLKYNYEKTDFDYFKAISRYNGGNKNYRYYNAVMNNMGILNKLIKEKIIN
jgi:hypothetical protein